MIDENTSKFFFRLKEAAQATCGNAFLMDDGRIITLNEYRGLSFPEKMHLIMFYRYSDGKLIKI